MKLILDRDVGRLQVMKSSNDVAIGHVPTVIVIGANDHDSGVPPTCGLHY